MSTQINNLKVMEEKRKTLRNNLTPAEAFLWKHLQKLQLENRKFRRQHSIGYYILDFYCPSEKLAVELDGAHHFTEEGIAYDKMRTEFIEQYGIKVIRFENEDVFKHTDAVLKQVKECFKK